MNLFWRNDIVSNPIITSATTTTTGQYWFTVVHRRAPRRESLKFHVVFGRAHERLSFGFNGFSNEKIRRCIAWIFPSPRGSTTVGRGECCPGVNRFPTLFFPPSESSLSRVFYFENGYIFHSHCDDKRLYSLRVIWTQRTGCPAMLVQLQ